MQDQHDVEDSYPLAEADIIITAMETGATKEVFLKIMTSDQKELDPSRDLRFDLVSTCITIKAVLFFVFFLNFYLVVNGKK